MVTKNRKIKTKTRKGKLTNVEKTFLEARRVDTTAEEMAIELDRSLAVVMKYLNSLPPLDATPDNIPAVPPPKPESASLSQMCPKNEDGQSKGIAIMTDGSSSIADDWYKKHARTTLNKFKPNIHKPKAK